MSDLKPTKILSLRAATGWLSAQPDGSFEANRAEIGPWEQFEVVPVEGFRLKTAHGHWLGGVHEALGWIRQENSGLYRLVQGPNGTVGLLDVENGKFLQVDQGDKPGVFIRGESLGPWEQFTLPKPSRILAPIQGQLRIANGSFSDDTGPRCVTMLHAGNLFLEFVKDPVKALAVLDLAAATGYHGLRVWTTLRGQWWADRSGEISPTITKNYWQLLTQFLTACAERGLVVHLAAGDLAWFKGGERADYHRGMADICASFGPTVALYEWANEARDTAGGLGVDMAIRDVQVIRDKFPGLVGLTAYTGHEDQQLFREWTPAWMEFVLVHALRDGRWWDKIRHIFSLPYEDKTRRRYWHGEPWGVGPRVSASTSNSMAELNATVYGMAAAQCLITGGVWTDFFSPGVILGDEKFEDYPQFGVAPRMAAKLESIQKQHGFSWGQLRLMHGGPGRPNVLEIFGGENGKEARVDQAIDDSRGVFLATVYGETTFRVKSKWNLKSLTAIDPVTCEETALRGADSEKFDGTKPCVLVGVRS